MGSGDPDPRITLGAVHLLFSANRWEAAPSLERGTGAADGDTAVGLSHALTAADTQGGKAQGMVLSHHLAHQGHEMRAPLQPMG